MLFLAVNWTICLHVSGFWRRQSAHKSFYTYMSDHVTCGPWWRTRAQCHHVLEANTSSSCRCSFICHFLVIYCEGRRGGRGLRAAHPELPFANQECFWWWSGQEACTVHRGAEGPPETCCLCPAWIGWPSTAEVPSLQGGRKGGLERPALWNSKLRLDTFAGDAWVSWCSWMGSRLNKWDSSRILKRELL